MSIFLYSSQMFFVFRSIQEVGPWHGGLQLPIFVVTMMHVVQVD